MSLLPPKTAEEAAWQRQNYGSGQGASRGVPPSGSYMAPNRGLGMGYNRHISKDYRSAQQTSYLPQHLQPQPPQQMWSPWAQPTFPMQQHSPYGGGFMPPWMQQSPPNPPQQQPMGTNYGMGMGGMGNMGAMQQSPLMQILMALFSKFM